MTTISVIRIENGIVKDVAHYDYLELESAHSTFKFHVIKDRCEIMKRDVYISQADAIEYGDELIEKENGYPSLFWEDYNSVQHSIQMILDI